MEVTWHWLRIDVPPLEKMEKKSLVLRNIQSCFNIFLKFFDSLTFSKISTFDSLKYLTKLDYLIL